MAFDIKNDPAAQSGAAAFNSQAEWDELAVQAMSQGDNYTGVLSGCAVTAQGSPDKTVAVAAGRVIVSGARAAVTANGALDLLTSNASDSTNPRIDLIVVDNAGTISQIVGTAAVEPCWPAITLDSNGYLARAVIAEIYIPANATTILSSYITDKRVIVHATEHRTSVADADYTMLSDDRIINYTSITANRTVTLCAANAVPAGYTVVIKDLAGTAGFNTSGVSSCIIIAAAGSDTIEGNATDRIVGPYGFIALYSNNGTKWMIRAVSPRQRIYITLNGSYTVTLPPSGHVLQRIQGAGGGGGSGRRAAAGGMRGGGGGGAGGCRVDSAYSISTLATTALTVVNGQGGQRDASHGTLISTNDTDGLPGNSGGDTTVSDGTRTWKASGGGGGAAGTNGGAAAAGTSGTIGMVAGQAGGVGGGTSAGTSPTAPTIASQVAAGGGGGGGGINASNTSIAGGAGGGGPLELDVTTGGAAGTLNGSGGTQNGTGGSNIGDYTASGGGGGSGTTLGGGAGASGGRSAGGAGGAGSVNGQNSGQGGQGGNGVVEFVVIR